MSVSVRVIEGRDLKNTQTLGKQDPYVLAFLAVDCSPLFGVSPDPEVRTQCLPGAPELLLKTQEWKSAVVEDGGVSPKWPEGEGSTHVFDYIPGADCVVLTLMNKNMTADACIGEMRISLHPAFLNGVHEAWHPVIRASGRGQGEVLVSITWTAPPVPPFRVLVPLTFELRSSDVPLTSSFSLSHKTFDDIQIMAGKKAGDREILAQMKAVLPQFVELFGEEAFPILNLGGAPVESVEPVAAQFGLKEHDIIVGYALDHKVTDGGRGVHAMMAGSIKWGRLEGGSREQILKELSQFDSKGSITITVLRAMPLRAIPDGHGLKVAFVVPPESFKYEPSSLSCIAAQPLAPLFPDVRPSQGRPFSFEAPDGLPEGLELSAEGVLQGTPSAAGKQAFKVVARNGKGSAETHVSVHVMQAPTQLQYALGHRMQYALGQPIALHTVSKIDGDGPFSFHAEPPLPRGLEIDPASGTISGSPLEACAEAMSTVTATSPAGAASSSLIVSVLAPPTALAYSAASATLTRGLPMQDIAVATLDGSPPYKFHCEPPLPSGLSIDPSTGSVAGVPASEAPSTEYKLRASNVAGSAECTLSLAVLEKPSGLRYQQGGGGAKLSYSAGCEVVENRVMSLTGSGPMAFTSNPGLPEGLTVDQRTGTISGTPTSEVPAALFEVIATNSVGSTACQLVLEVAAAEDSQGDAAFNPDAAQINQPLEQLQGPGSDVKAFLERVGVQHRFDDLIKDGWDTLDMIFAMSKLDLTDAGLTDEEAEKVLAGQPSAERAQDRRAMKRFMADKGFQDLEPVLVGRGVKGLSKLRALSVGDLMSFGVPPIRAQALVNELQQLAGGSPSPAPPPPVVNPAPSLLEPQVAQAGVGLTVSQMPPTGQWFVTDVIPGGAAFTARGIANGDMLQAVTSSATGGAPVKIGPGTTLDDIRRLILGPVGSYVTLTLMRRGTRFDMPLRRAPTAAPRPEQRPGEAVVTLTVRAARATNLPAMDRSGTSDPYVIIQCNGQSFKSPVIWKTLNPVWNADFTVRVTPSTRLVISVWDKDSYDPDDLIGKLNVAVSDVVNFDDRNIKMGILKGRLAAPHGGTTHGKDGNVSHLFLEFPGLQP